MIMQYYTVQEIYCILFFLLRAKKDEVGIVLVISPIILLIFVVYDYFITYIRNIIFT